MFGYAGAESGQHQQHPAGSDESAARDRRHGTREDTQRDRRCAPNPPRFGRDTYSRAVEYAIDESSGTVREVWSYGGPGSDWFLSAFISEADTLPTTGNVLLTNGGRVRLPDGTDGTFPEEGRLWATLTEVTHTTPPEKVWEVVIDHPAMGWSSYRTERLSGLYP